MTLIDSSFSKAAEIARAKAVAPVQPQVVLKRKLWHESEDQAVVKARRQLRELALEDKEVAKPDTSTPSWYDATQVRLKARIHLVHPAPETEPLHQSVPEVKLDQLRTHRRTKQRHGFRQKPKHVLFHATGVKNAQVLRWPELLCFARNHCRFSGVAQRQKLHLQGGTSKMKDAQDWGFDESQRMGLKVVKTAGIAFDGKVGQARETAARSGQAGEHGVDERYMEKDEEADWKRQCRLRAIDEWFQDGVDVSRSSGLQPVENFIKTWNDATFNSDSVEGIRVQFERRVNVFGHFSQFPPLGLRSTAPLKHLSMAAPSSETFVWFEERPVVIHVPQAPIFYGPHWPFTVARPITLAFDAATEGNRSRRRIQNRSYQRFFPANLHGSSGHPDVLLVADMTVIIGLPAELRRILESRKIVKLGVGLNSDASILYKDFGVDSFNLRDLGYMIRIAYPERFADECNNVSLQACVEHIFSLTLSKQLRKYDWRSRYSPPGASNRDAVIHYAAADAEATLMMNRPIQLAVRDKAIFLHRHLPSYWYTYHYVQDACVRILLDWNNEVVGWKWTICPWYAKGKFSGYWE
ncbi:hypothetical protein R3P38DRAFT_3230329 [Favolaschia claudopus]|uniref:3'-5' exonuclease domain-containing protein n=1 Tax=Favolaschia claudopus TaxID=2862362 RepID=A0AAV9ZMR9_9AGAR